MTRRRTKKMLRESWAPEKVNPKKRKEKQVEVDQHITDIRNNARGDVLPFVGNEPNPVFLTAKYDGIHTHWEGDYKKNQDYEHGELQTPAKSLIWCSITKK